jgi:hypothetical protein
MKLRSDKIKAGTMALATAFSLNALMPSYVEAQSAQQVDATASTATHPLFEVRAKYRSNLSLALVAATKDNKASLTTAVFVKALEEKLAAPALARPQSVTAPNKDVVPSMLVLTGVIPPASMYSTTPISVCAEKDDRVVATYLIQPNGEVKEDKHRGPNGTGPADSFQFACKPHAVAYVKEFRDSMNASVNPAGGQSAPDASSVKQ